MKIAPIVYGRTKFCDFKSGFLCRPSFLTSTAVDQAVIAVKGAIDLSEGERWLITDMQGFRLAGVVIRIHDLIRKLDMNEEEKAKAKVLAVDERNRGVHAFIGGVFFQKDLPSKESFSYELLWELYQSNVHKIWENTLVNTGFTETSDYKGSVISVHKGSWKTLSGRNFSESNPLEDKKIFDSFLEKPYSEEISFCSNLSSLSAVQSGIEECGFKQISAPSSLISRLEDEPELLGDCAVTQSKGRNFSTKAEFVSWLNDECSDITINGKNFKLELSEKCKMFKKEEELLLIFKERR